MEHDPQVRTVVITGGAQGLGLEIGRACAAQGAHVVLIDVDGARLESARHELAPAPVETHVCDISDAMMVAAVLRSIALAHPGGVGALVNNAGIFTTNAIERVYPARAAQALAVNVTGTMNVTNAALDLGLLDAGSGQIVFVNSSAGDPLATGTGKSERTYAATKGALTAYAKAVEAGCAGTRIRVTTVYPGGMDTNLYANAGWTDEDSHGQAWMLPPARVAATIAFVLALPPDTTISRLAIGPNL